VRDSETSVPIIESIQNSDHCFTAAELAHLLNIHKLTVYRHVKAGRLKAFYVGAALRIQPTAVADWLRGRSETNQRVA
jgi:excisionase family DNA binding protein